MNFHRRRTEEPEINLIPFIDVLLVVLIFLMLSTTYSRYAELQINLPTAEAEKLKERPSEILVGITGDGRFSINRSALDGSTVELLTAALQRAAGPSGGSANNPPVVIVSADALTPHQSVISVMDAARRAGLTRLTFATQLPAESGSR